MKIVVMATSPDPGSPISERFGRAPWLYMVDSASGLEEAVPNIQPTDSDQEAAVRTARKVVDLGARVVLSNRYNPRAFEILEAAGVRVFSGLEGTVAEVLAWYAGGYLVPAGRFDGEPYWA